LTIKLYLTFFVVVSISCAVGASSLGVHSGFVCFSILFFNFLSFGFPPKSFLMAQVGWYLLLSLSCSTSFSYIFGFTTTLLSNSSVWMYSPPNAGLYCAVATFVPSLILLLPNFAIVVFLFFKCGAKSRGNVVQERPMNNADLHD